MPHLLHSNILRHLFIHLRHHNSCSISDHHLFTLYQVRQQRRQHDRGLQDFPVDRPQLPHPLISLALNRQKILKRNLLCYHSLLLFPIFCVLCDYYAAGDRCVLSEELIRFIVNDVWLYCVGGVLGDCVYEDQAVY